MWCERKGIMKREQRYMMGSSTESTASINALPVRVSVASQMIYSSDRCEYVTSEAIFTRSASPSGSGLHRMLAGVDLSILDSWESTVDESWSTICYRLRYHDVQSSNSRLDMTMVS